MFIDVLLAFCAMATIFLLTLFTVRYAPMPIHDRLNDLEASVAAVKARLDSQDAIIHSNTADEARLQAIIDQLNTLANPPVPQPPTTGA
jgi:hypothetical protein